MGNPRWFLPEQCWSSPYTRIPLSNLSGHSGAGKAGTVVCGHQRRGLCQHSELSSSVRLAGPAETGFTWISNVSEYLLPQKENVFQCLSGVFTWCHRTRCPESLYFRPLNRSSSPRLPITKKILIHIRVPRTFNSLIAGEAGWHSQLNGGSTRICIVNERKALG